MLLLGDEGQRAHPSAVKVGDAGKRASCLLLLLRGERRGVGAWRGVACLVGCCCVCAGGERPGASRCVPQTGADRCIKLRDLETGVPNTTSFAATGDGNAGGETRQMVTATASLALVAGEGSGDARRRCLMSCSSQPYTWIWPWGVGRRVPRRGDRGCAGGRQGGVLAAERIAEQAGARRRQGQRWAMAVWSA